MLIEWGITWALSAIGATMLAGRVLAWTVFFALMMFLVFFIEDIDNDDESEWTVETE